MFNAARYHNHKIFYNQDGTWKIERYFDNEQTQIRAIEYFNARGEWDRKDGPAATIFFQGGKRSHEIWYQRGQMHRDGNKPAWISYSRYKVQSFELRSVPKDAMLRVGSNGMEPILATIKSIKSSPAKNQKPNDYEVPHVIELSNGQEIEGVARNTVECYFDVPEDVIQEQKFYRLGSEYKPS